MQLYDLAAQVGLALAFVDARALARGQVGARVTLQSARARSGGSVFRHGTTAACGWQLHCSAALRGRLRDELARAQAR